MQKLCHSDRLLSSPTEENIFSTEAYLEIVKPQESMPLVASSCWVHTFLSDGLPAFSQMTLIKLWRKKKMMHSLSHPFIAELTTYLIPLINLVW